jgi:plastocyanin
LRVTIGATVTFNGALDEHPVLGFIGASTPNPITYLSAPPAMSVAFMSAGFFPFGCTLHEAERGVVWVE